MLKKANRRIFSSLLFVLGALAAGTAAGQTSIVSELPPPDPQSSGFYGWSAALSEDGNTALVGAEGQGRAYVFVRTGGVWTLDSPLPPAFPRTRGFGFSVSLSADGTVALVSNPDEFCPNPIPPRCGAAFVFARQGGTWIQEAHLGPTEVTDFDGNFGYSAALSADGSTALVGQLLANCVGGICRGKAVAFHRNPDGTWTSEGELPAPSPAEAFGASVALSPDGNTALIGAARTNCASFENCGSAYIFTRSGGVWSQQAELAASDRQQNTYFGSTVSLAADGVSALISAPGDSSPFASNAGAVYAFAQSGGVWTERQKIPGGDNGDGFGQALSLSPDGLVALVGAGGTDCTSGNDNCGAVYRLSRQGAVWTSPQALPLGFAPGDFGGYSVALSEGGRTGLVGAIGTACAAGASCGTAYIVEALPAPEPGIPTASHLGLALLALLLAASGAWVLARRRSV